LCADKNSIKFWHRCQAGTVSYSPFRFTCLINFLLYSWCTNLTRNFCYRAHISSPGLCSRKESPEALRFAIFQWQSEWTTNLYFCRLAKLQAEILWLFIFLFVSLYILSNIKSKMMFVKCKKWFRLAFRHVSNSFTFYITVEECWSKRYVCIAYNLGNIVKWLFACWMLLFYILHTLHNQF